MNKVLRPVAFLFLAVWFAHPVFADVLVYADESGKLHFTDRPENDSYRIYIKTADPAPVKREVQESRFDREIEKAAKQHALEPRLIRSVIEVESAFNPRAVSPAGAMGLMQLMPATANRYGVSNVFAPDDNIRAGTHHLRELLDAYNGNLGLALAAYNAGMDAVRKYDGIPPYPETKNYVRKVMALYNGKPQTYRRTEDRRRVYRYVEADGTVYLTDTPKPIY